MNLVSNLPIVSKPYSFLVTPSHYLYNFSDDGRVVTKARLDGTIDGCPVDPPFASDRPVSVIAIRILKHTHVANDTPYFPGAYCHDMDIGITTPEQRGIAWLRGCNAAAYVSNLGGAFHRVALAFD